MHQPLKIWGQMRPRAHSKAPRWADLLQPKPLLLVSHAAGGLLQGGGSRAIPSWGHWNGGSHVGHSGWPQSPVNTWGTMLGSVAVRSCALMRCTSFHGAFPGFPFVDCLWRYSAAVRCLPLLPGEVV